MDMVGGASATEKHTHSQLSNQNKSRRRHKSFQCRWEAGMVQALLDLQFLLDPLTHDFVCLLTVTGLRRPVLDEVGNMVLLGCKGCIGHFLLAMRYNRKPSPVEMIFLQVDFGVQRLRSNTLKTGLKNDARTYMHILCSVKHHPSSHRAMTLSTS